MEPGLGQALAGLAIGAVGGVDLLLGRQPEEGLELADDLATGRAGIEGTINAFVELVRDRNELGGGGIPAEEREIVYTSGTTDSINLVMHGYGRKFIGAGDEIICPSMTYWASCTSALTLGERRLTATGARPGLTRPFQGELQRWDHHRIFRPGCATLLRPRLLTLDRHCSG